MQASRHLLYVLTDTSGSTSRGGFNAGWNRALPGLVTVVERIAGPKTWISFLSYADDASVRTALQRVGDLEVLPVLRAGGLSGLASAFRLLARTIDEDCAQLAADGLGFEPPVAVLVADGLATDPDEDVLAARDEVRPRARLYAIMPTDVDRLAVAGLADRCLDLNIGTAQSVSDSVLLSLETVLVDVVRGPSPS